jgi:hypothetical protein
MTPTQLEIEISAAEPVAQRLRQTIRRLPAAKRRSLTVDNGREFARPTELEKKLEVPLYFAHPYHAWERGTNENTNGLLRQYLPKGTDLSQITDEQLQSHVRQINHRPRKCLGFQTAFEIFRPRPAGIVLATRSPVRYTGSAGAEDRALVGSNPSAVLAQGQEGRRCSYTASPDPLILFLAQSEKSQGSGDSVPSGTQVNRQPMGS